MPSMGGGGDYGGDYGGGDGAAGYGGGGSDGFGGDYSDSSGWAGLGNIEDAIDDSDFISVNAPNEGLAPGTEAEAQIQDLQISTMYKGLLSAIIGVSLPGMVYTAYSLNKSLSDIKNNAIATYGEVVGTQAFEAAMAARTGGTSGSQADGGVGGEADKIWSEAVALYDNENNTDISNSTGQSAVIDGTTYSLTDGDISAVTMPSNIPDYLQPGLQEFVDNSQSVTDDYNAKADTLWTDYLDFEKTYFNKYENNQTEYDANLASMPSVNLTMPDTMGGATVSLAPTVHSEMYTDQFNAKNDSIGDQANTSLAGLGSRDALAKNQFSAGQSNVTNSMIPTQAGLDLYKLERSGELGIDAAEAGTYEPSTVSTWAPVVGSVLSSDTGSSVLDSAWDYVSGLFS